jgi:peptide/nickel transport system substrate-binding protein
VARLLIRPTNPLFQDARVRQALLLAINRDQMVKTFFNGQTQVSHTVLHPREEGYDEAMRTVVQYPFDPRQALALMEQAGWRRGSDGVLQNADGEPFEVRYRVIQDDSLQSQIQQTVANDWRDIGVRTVFDNVAARVYNDLQEQASYTGVLEFHGTTTVDALFRRFHSSAIPRAETRYAGDNNTEWSNPQADRLLEQLQVTLEPEARKGIVAQFGTLVSQELPTLPLYYVAEPVAIAKGLQYARPRPMGSNQYNTTWNTFQWEWA